MSRGRSAPAGDRPLTVYATLPQGTAALTLVLGRPFKLRLEFAGARYELDIRALVELIIRNQSPLTAGPTNGVRGTGV